MLTASSRRSLSSVVAGAVLICSLPLLAQPIPIGSEFQINTYTTGSQASSSRSIAAGGNGDFIAVWDFDTSLDFEQVHGQRYASNGAPVGAEFLANTMTGVPQVDPAVSATANGDFVVVWTGEAPILGNGIIGRRYSSSGTPQGTEFRANFVASMQLDDPDVASEADGDFVVVWDSDESYVQGIHAQRFASGGAKVGTEFIVSQIGTSTPDTHDPAVAKDSNGNFVVVWYSEGQDGDAEGVFGRRYTSSGAALGTEFAVNSSTIGDQSYPSVATQPDGDFLVAWHHIDLPDFDVRAQLYASTGSPIGGEFVVNAITTYAAEAPDVAADSNGEFLVLWFYNFPSSGYEVFAQSLAADGSPVGSEFQVNTYTSADEGFPAVAAQSPGRFVAMWTGDAVARDGDQSGVFGQVLGGAPGNTATVTATSTQTHTPTATPTATSTSTATATPTATETVAAAVCPPTPAVSCGASVKGGLGIKDNTDDAKDKLIWKWSSGSGATTQSAFGDPLTTGSFAFCVYDGTTLVLEASLGPVANWSAISDKGYKYKDKSGASSGLTKVLLKSGPDGKAKIKVKGKGTALPLPGPVGLQYFTQSVAVTAQLHAQNGNCWSNSFTAAQTTVNETEKFKAKF